jgi:hypothetical protein
MPRAHRVQRAGRLTALVLATLLVSTIAHALSSALNDGSHDEVKATKVVPDPSRKVGEVRLLARGQAVVVQTVISTKLLDRVTGEIRKKEEGNWPAGDPSREAYLAALEKVRANVEKRDVGADWKDRRRRLLIEFAADDRDAAVFLGTFRATGGDGSTIEREVLETLDLPRSYVLRNMRLILADSFKVAEAEVDSIGPLGPASASAASATKAGNDAPAAKAPVPATKAGGDAPAAKPSAPATKPNAGESATPPKAAAPK